jgi:transposase
VPRRKPLFLLADRILNGELTDHLIRWRNAGVSTRAMAALLEQEVGVKFTHETIRRWLQDLPPANGDPIEAA